MLDEEQRRTVVEMFGSGKSVSEISRKVGISRPSVYRVIASDVEKDAEILSLKKELRKTELRKKIEEVREPIKIRDELDTLDRAIHHLMGHVVFMWDLNPKLKSPHCFYCEETLEYNEKKGPEGERISYWFKCPKCKRVYHL